MLFDKPGKLSGVAAVGQRASGFGIGHEHRLVGAKYLCGLPHEMHPAKHYHFCIEAGRNLGQGE